MYGTKPNRNISTPIGNASGRPRMTIVNHCRIPPASETIAVPIIVPRRIPADCRPTWSTRSRRVVETRVMSPAHHDSPSRRKKNTRRMEMTRAKMTPAALAMSAAVVSISPPPNPRTKPAAVAPMPNFSAPSAPWLMISGSWVATV